MSTQQNSESLRDGNPSWSGYAIIALTLLAPILGGASELWAQTTICLGCALLMIIAPPRQSLGLWINIAFVALALLALAAFPPASWFAQDQLRVAFSRIGIQLPATRTAQPWLTLQSTALLWLGLAWAYHLLAYNWSRQQRISAWIIYCIAMLGLAAALAISNTLNWKVPFWPDVLEFGFFPNRNQTSNVLALGGIMIYGTVLQRFREGQKTWWLWLASLALICWALILNYSRSGIILFFVGAFVCHLCWLKTSRWRNRAFVTLGSLLIILALFIAVGGETLARFGILSLGDARIAIYRDVFAFSTESPLFGIGLGNFGALFSLHRQYSASQTLAIHPESDWLWAAIEMGWFAPFLIAALFVWWIRQTSPFEPGTSRLLRIAATISGCAFAIHGLFDVSGHRLGALWPALFLASTAIHPSKRFRASRSTAVIFRFIGIGLAAIGIWWLASTGGAKTWPTTATLDRIKFEIENAIDRNDYAGVVSLSNNGLRIAPLDWKLYYKRASAEAPLSYSVADARRDFAAARYLLPYWPELCFQEGTLWLAVGEFDLAFEAWSEALRRSSEKAPGLYSQMFELIKGDAALIDRWRMLGRTDKCCALIFLAHADSFEFSLELERLLSEDRESRTGQGVSQLSSFSPAELKTLFKIWYRNGNKSELAQILEERPEWKKIGWQELSQVYADREDFRRAYEIAVEFAPPPDIPKRESQESLETLKARFLLDRTDIDTGLPLYFAQLKENQAASALATLRELEILPGSPKYLFVLEARSWAQQQKWKEAWLAMAQYISQG